jgi:hypothetical protein
MLIARVCGWDHLPKDPEMIQYTARNPEGKWGEIPHYTTDLNAMHKAEDALGDGYKRVHYLDTLCWVCRRDGMNVRWLEAPFANAAQKAEAFLYVFGLWEDSESQREAAGTADEKPDGQAENADVEARPRCAPPQQDGF